MLDTHNTLIGLTGGIGAGKSVVARILRSRGYVVYDCDKEAKRIITSSSFIRKSLAEKIGQSIIDCDGNIDNRQLASKLFSDTESRIWFNSIVHAMVKDDIIHTASGINSQSDYNKPMFVEAAVMSSSGITEIFKRIWLVEAPTELRIKRVMARSAMQANEVEARIESQKHEFHSLPHDITDKIENDGITPLVRRVDHLLGKISENRIV